MKKLPLSVVIITKNEEINIGKCISAASDLSDDILVLDGYSTDQTVSIAKNLGARVVQHKWLGFAKTKNYANQLTKFNWILSLDADEVVSEDLKKSIQELSLSEGQEIVFSLDRITDYFGFWVRHSGWYPDWKPRLFDKRFIQWDGDFVHERLVVPQGFLIKKLKGKLWHFSYQSEEDIVQRRYRYARLAAEFAHSNGKKASWWQIYITPYFRWIKTYVLKRGFLDGEIGKKIAKHDAAFVRLKYKLLREMR